MHSGRRRVPGGVRLLGRLQIEPVAGVLLPDDFSDLSLRVSQESERRIGIALVVGFEGLVLAESDSFQRGIVFGWERCPGRHGLHCVFQAIERFLEPHLSRRDAPGRTARRCCLGRWQAFAIVIRRGCGYGHRRLDVHGHRSLVLDHPLCSVFNGVGRRRRGPGRRRSTSTGIGAWSSTTRSVRSSTEGAGAGAGPAVDDSTRGGTELSSRRGSVPVRAPGPVAVRSRHPLRRRR